MRKLLENTDCVLEIKSIPIDTNAKGFEKTEHYKKIKRVVYYEPYMDNNGLTTYVKIVLDEYLLDRLFEEQKRLREDISIEEVESNLPF